MKNAIYYFSGTGNSLAIAKKLNDMMIEKNDIISIPNIMKQKIITEADSIGFIFPVY